MVFMPNTITLTKSERMELTKQATRRSGRAEDARRARLVLLLAEGHTWDDICDRLPCSRGFIDSWSKRFAAERVAGLYSRHRGQAASVLTPRLEARILDWTLKRKPTDGSTHWSTRKLGQALGVSHMMVSRVWAKHRLQPHRLERYLTSNDPEFEAKAADVIGLYLNPPAHAAVFCVDEKTAIQALDRLDRYCRCRPDAPNAMVSSITVTARCLCTLPSTPRPAKFSARPRRGIPRPSLSPF